MNDNLNLGTASSYEKLPEYHQQMSPSEAAMKFFKDYSRERPEVVALWCIGIGFILGWKLKPW